MKGHPGRRSGMHRQSLVWREFGYIRSSLGGSTLRRRTDRSEALVRVVLCVLAVVATVLVTAYAITITGWFSERAAAQAVNRHKVEAVVVADAPTIRLGREAIAAPNVPVPVRWHDADGRLRSGRLVVNPGTTAGTETSVWLDGAGNQVTAPLRQQEVLMPGLALGIGGEAITVLTLWLAGRGARKVLDRRRLAEWERDWAEADARWRGRRHRPH